MNNNADGDNADDDINHNANENVANDDDGNMAVLNH